MRKRVLSVLLVLSLFILIFPIEIAALAATDGDGLCPHHTEHNGDCDYVCEICEGLAEDAGVQEETTEVTTPSDATKMDATVEEVQALIASLPSVEDVAAMSEDEQQATYEYLQAVYDAYLSLSEEQHSLMIGAEVFDELFAFFNAQIDPLDDSTSSNATEYGGELHFIVRHWHTTDPTDNSSQFQGDTPETSNNRYFVVVEGYIVPQADGTYKFYFVYQSDTDEHEAGDRLEITDDEDITNKSDYILDVDSTAGTITLNAAPVAEMEELTTFSVSAGHNAIADNNDSITIQYKENVHLIKAHVFYLRTKMLVAGTDDETVFETVSGSDNITSYPQQDTALVYTYVNDYETHKAGEIAKNSSGVPYKKGATLPTELEGQVELTKVYSTNIGLHTDKTASVYTSTKDNDLLDDDRTFNLDLEAWYAEGYASQVGMILDASGSMGFASDKPTPINVDDFDVSVRTRLQNKIGMVEDKGFTWTEQVTFPQYTNLLGYYEFRKNQNGNNRNWYLNSKKHAPSTNYADMQDGYFAKHVFQPNGDDFDFSQEKQQTLMGSTNWGAVSFSEMYGYSLLKENINAGFLLESVPTGNDFTLSFTLIQSEANQTDQDVEVLYIGSETGNRNESSYFHVIRQGNDIVVSFVADGVTVSSFTLPTRFAIGSERVITFVFDNGQMTAYMDGVEKASVDVSGLSHDAIVFAPFMSEGGTGTDYFFVDNIYLFDTVLNSGEINDLILVAGSTLRNTVDVTFDAFLTPDELALLMDTHNTDNSKLGSAGYSYFVYEPSSNSVNVTLEYTPLGYYPDDAAEKLFNVKGAGWYYSSYTSTWNNYKNGTAKTLHAIVNKQEFKDYIEVGTNEAEIGKGAAPDLNITPANTEHTYTATGNSPSKFYIDNSGYLRCFFSPDSAYINYTSYVYKLSDSQYIKAEALQRALGLFVTELADQSPATQVSAARFHSNEVPNNELDSLVLLDWTNDPSESASIMALKRGNGTTTGYDTSATNGVEQYNYALTGSTSTWRGLQAYVTNLQVNDNPYKDANGDPVEGVPKYLILFTDGKDTDQNIYNEVTITLGDNTKTVRAREAAKELANYLKNDCGYTIFTVLLNGGPVEEGGADYDDAHDFLLSLSGYQGATASEQENYFFSVSKAERTLKNRGEDISGMNDADILTEIFAEEILRQITRPLEDYTVQDYIDPRFDLVDADGVLWHLNDGGYVVKGNGTGEGSTFTLNAALKTQIKISDKSNQKALEPYLCYDADNGMYYLVWTGQTIPSSSIGAERLPIWNAQVTVRAKDDFIGGNAVLTNGNDGTDTLYGTGNTGGAAPQADESGKAGQNYVYFGGIVESGKKDDRRSSGIDDMYRTGQVPSSSHDWSQSADDYPSKGFPRVTVNVPPYRTEAQEPDLIYMGESLSIHDIVQNLIDAANVDKCTYYWEYLERLGVVEDNDLVDLTQFVLENESLEETYRYLPAKDTDAKTLTGTDAHRADILGMLTYKIDAQNPGLDAFMAGQSITKKDTNPINVTLTVDYDPLDDPSHDNSEAQGAALGLPADRKAANDTFVQENVYPWDPDYKPAVGDEWTDKVVIKVGDQVDVVSGQIILQMQVGANVAGSVTYKADLWRTYTDANGTVQKEKVGTLEATGGSGQTVAAKLTALQGDYAAYVPTYGLPIGTYTLVPSAENADGFSEIKAVTVEQEVFAAANSDTTNNLTVYDLSGDRSNQVTEFLADSSSATTTSDATAYLGTKDPAKGTVYTDDRYAQFLVTIDDTPTVPEDPTGNLTVTKTVTGNAGETDREFHFTVTIGDEPFTFTLKDGESWTSKDFPTGTDYSVTETDANEYGYTTTMPSNAIGTIQENQTVTVEIVNHKESSDPGTDPDPTDPTPGPDDPTDPTPGPDDPTDPTPGPDDPTDPTPGPDDPTDPTPGPDDPTDPTPSPTPDTPLVPEPSGAMDDVPQTGDNSNLALWTTLMILSLAGIALALFFQKR